jgi:23S rRNA (uracil1939-C5)-methyltransferase
MLLTIEKLIYGGEGLARLPQDEGGRGKSVFVPFVLEGERVEAAVVEQKQGFARAHLRAVVEPSSRRVPPGCSYFAECGGCQYQHTDYENQLRIKERILRETFARIAKLDLPSEVQVHASPPWNYRNRTRMRVQAGASFALGYNRFRSAEVLPVHECPISSPLLNRAISVLWKLGSRGVVPRSLREVEWFADENDQHLLMEVTAAERSGAEEWKQFARDLRETLPEAAGIGIFQETQRGGGRHLQPLQARGREFGGSSLLYHCAGGEYRVSAGSFFQTNRFLADELASVATADLGGHEALDLYAGVGLFSLVLARTFERVSAVEISSASFADLKRNVPANVTARKISTEGFLQNLPPKARFDCVVVDPPRAGLGESVARKVSGLAAATVVYASCDPSTQARDVRVLVEAGYRIEQAHLLDLFPQTFHMESVLRLRR